VRGNVRQSQNQMTTLNVKVIKILCELKIKNVGCDAQMFRIVHEQNHVKLYQQKVYLWTSISLSDFWNIFVIMTFKVESFDFRVNLI